MTTTAFITRCWKNAPRQLQALDWLTACLVWLALLLAVGASRADMPDIVALRADRSEEGVFLTAQIQFELPAVVDDALAKGIPLFFVADTVLLRDRWYWYDKEVASAARYTRLSYQPLTRRWRLHTSNTPIGPTGLSLGQSFDTREEALAAVRNISHWKIAEPADLDLDSRYNVSFRFRLDVSQLPRPFQIGVVGQSEWSLEATRSIRLGAESPR